MIRYTLACGDGHGFESWFASSAAYDRQAARAKVPSLQHGRRFEILEPMAEPAHLHVVGGDA